MLLSVFCTVNVSFNLSLLLKVSEVQVSKPAFQSSSYDETNTSPDRAVDGNLDAHLMASWSCSHTQEETNPWWFVDLGELYIVTGVILKNRAECCGEIRFYIKS